MHLHFKPIPPEDVVQHINDSLPLDGRAISAPDLFLALSQENSTNPCLIENAVLIFDAQIVQLPENLANRPLTFRHCTFFTSASALIRLGTATFRASVEFEGCTFQEAVEFTGWSFDPTANARMVLKACTFLGPARFTSCSFTEIALQDAVFHRELRFRDCKFNTDPPKLANSRFHGQVELTGARCYWDRSRYFKMHHCVFEDDLVLGSLDRAVEYSFDHCTFSQNCIALIRLGVPQPDSPLEKLRFHLVNSTVVGRVDVLPPRKDEADLACPPMSVSLYSSAIIGEVDLSRMKVSLDLKGTSIPNGLVLVQCPEKSGLLDVPPDLDGILACEQANTPDPVEASKQYGELRNSYARTSSTIEQEEFCHYKFKDYRRKADLAKLGGWNEYRCLLWAVLISVGILLASALFASVDSNSLAAITCMIGLFGILVSISMLRGKFVNFFSITWDYIYKGLLGYGVYARRVLQTAGFVIFGFAFLYWFCSACWPEFGYVRYDKNNFLVPLRGQQDLEPVLECESVANGPDRKFEIPPPAWSPAAMRQSLYYSVITFTTVGYGDYSAAGNMQYLAALEAFLGALLIATLIAVIARKFIR